MDLSSTAMLAPDANESAPTPVPVSQMKVIQNAQALQSQSLTPQQLFEGVQSSVVQITDTSESNPLSSRLGSGFVYDTNGHIITNNHVVSGIQEGRIDVTFLDGTIYRAKLIGSDPYTDLAVLSVESISQDKLIPVSFANSSNLRVGEPVAAIGNPFGLSGSMTTGIVSGVGRTMPAQQNTNSENDSGGYSFSIPDIIQTDAAINPGNSGGPLLNMRGEVIGINSAIFSRTGEFAGIGFAIPTNTLTKVVPSLIDVGSFKHAWLGVVGTNMKPEIAEALGLEEPKGFLVVSVVPNSPAANSGIRGGNGTSIIDGREVTRGGDVILAVDGQEIRKIEDILVYLQRHKSVGDSTTVTVFRDSTFQDINLILGERPLPSS